MLIVTFGLAGAGKTYIGKLIALETGFYFYDGDSDLTEEMKTAIDRQEQFTRKMVDVFFLRLEKKVDLLLTQHQNVVVSQAFFTEKNRKNFLRKFPQAIFVLIKAEKQVRFKRLEKRAVMPLTAKYVEDMDVLFENPTHPIITIENSEDGESNALRQIQEKIIPRLTNNQ